MFFRFEIEDMPLDNVGVPLNLDFPALLAQKSGLIAILSQKQPHLIAGAAIGGAGRADEKLDHPSGLIPKSLYGENVMSFQLPG